eukprot:250345-Amorphochlora_amoeboformis.AAC.1
MGRFSEYLELDQAREKHDGEQKKLRKQQEKKAQNIAQSAAANGWGHTRVVTWGRVTDFSFFFSVFLSLPFYYTRNCMFSECRERPESSRL